MSRAEWYQGQKELISTTAEVNTLYVVEKNGCEL
jgi:hypothetical protein